MNFKLIFKAVFIVALLWVLVIMGTNNYKEIVKLSLPPLLPKTIQQNAAMMYYMFFGVGFLAGTIIMVGGGKKGGKSPKGE